MINKREIEKRLIADGYVQMSGNFKDYTDEIFISNFLESIIGYKKEIMGKIGFDIEKELDLMKKEKPQFKFETMRRRSSKTKIC